MIFDWNTALEKMENGEKVRRTDWGHYKEAYINILNHNEADFIYIHNMYPNCHLELFSLSYSDLKSNNWTSVE